MSERPTVAKRTPTLMDKVRREVNNRNATRGAADDEVSCVMCPCRRRDED